MGSAGSLCAGEGLGAAACASAAVGYREGVAGGGRVEPGLRYVDVRERRRDSQELGHPGDAA